MGDERKLAEEVNHKLIRSGIFFFFFGPAKIAHKKTLSTSGGRRWVPPFSSHLMVPTGPPRRLSGKESACQCRKCGFSPRVRKIPLEEEMATHFSILALKIPWTESLAGYSSWGHKESDMPE